MNRILLILIFTFVLACRTTDVAIIRSESESESKVETCELLIRFSSDEALKRLMVRLESMRLEIVTEISASDHIHRLRLNCKADDIEGLIHKLNQQEGVEWVSRLD